MSRKLKNGELYIIKQVFVAIKDKGTNKFKLAIIRNEMIVDGYIKALEELRKPSAKMEEFKKKRDALLAEHAEADGGGLVVYTEPGGKGQRAQFGYPNIVKDKEAYESKMAALTDEYKDEFEKEAETQKAFMLTLEEEATGIDFVKIPFADIPEISYEELKTLMPIIEV